MASFGNFVIPVDSSCGPSTIQGICMKSEERGTGKVGKEPERGNDLPDRILRYGFLGMMVVM
ncbi:hypothetical protein BIFGAL_03670 [Bifidobacterium gallicum DSM 20093 = LMG 11596]|uniref:Uncharacterized protein n=1 Tax=Bifidobacterium gallicum DSM 20093 = LMG 11596 TaxID=561180 RepID=D1NUZ2_9BIFI|nr:hypothetical protein BIFGAL_03670 [Bifidobacterium gallicum DSM 20093 = LMG 11596]